MTTTTAVDASRVLAELDTHLDAARLADEIERYLADQKPARPATAHPLVTLPTAELVRQALDAADRTGAAAAPQAPTPAASPLRGIWRVLPDRLLALRCPRGPVGYRDLSIAQHLELTASVLQHSGWARTGRRARTLTGRRCILGAQVALYALGYGDAQTANAAGAYLNHVLRDRGIRSDYSVWNETADRGQVLNVIRAAADLAGSHR